MRLLLNLLPARSTLCLVLACLASRATSYFIVTEPTANTQWKNGQNNLLTWTKGLQDGISAFDVEMSRLSSDGLTLVAKNVPATTNSLNIYLQDVPPGDDYFLLLLNSTHGAMNAVSARFAILPSNSTGPSPTSAKGAATVTVSGSPNPLADFATTFASTSNGGPSLLLSPQVRRQAWGIMTAFVCLLVGAVWTIW